jgi:hypothetical protein
MTTTTNRRMTATEKAERAARSLRRLAAATFALGALASVGANIVAAEPTIIGRVVSSWPAVALLLTVHLFQHAPRVWWVKVMVGVVAGVAAWISYWHMVDVATLAGEGIVSAHLLPFTVDAMMAVASVVMTYKPKPVRRPVRKVPKR